MLHQTPSIALAADSGPMRAMFAARKRVFVDLLHWDVPVIADAYEVDQFDTAEAEYLILIDHCGRHRASTRLLRTDQPHILATLYPFLCAGPVPSGPGVREITRFCLDPDQPTAERRLARNQLVRALVEYALEQGISDYTGVATQAWFDQIVRFGWQCTALGPGMQIGGDKLVALHIRIDDQTLAALEAAAMPRTQAYGLTVVQNESHVAG